MANLFKARVLIYLIILAVSFGTASEVSAAKKPFCRLEVKKLGIAVAVTVLLTTPFWRQAFPRDSWVGAIVRPSVPENLIERRISKLAAMEGKTTTEVQRLQFLSWLNTYQYQMRSDDPENYRSWIRLEKMSFDQMNVAEEVFDLFSEPYEGEFLVDPNKALYRISGSQHPSQVFLRPQVFETGSIQQWREAFQKRMLALSGSSQTSKLSHQEHKAFKRVVVELQNYLDQTDLSRVQGGEQKIRLQAFQELVDQAIAKSLL